MLYISSSWLYTVQKLITLRFASQSLGLNNSLHNKTEGLIIDPYRIKDKKRLLSEKEGMEFLDCLDITDAGRICIKASLDILWKANSQKEILTREIMREGTTFHEKVKILISIKGITPLSAPAFLADVGDIKRFKSVRKMNSYLGLVPKVKESANKGKSCISGKPMGLELLLN